MTGVLLSLVLTSLYLLQASESINIQPDLDVQKLAGRWTLVALVIDRGELTDYNRYLITVEPENNGEMVYVAEAYQDNECKEVVIRLIQGEKPGIYTKGQSTLYFVKADYSRYHMVFVDTTIMKALHLYTREPEPSADIIAIYKAVAKSLDLPADKIIYLHRSAPCPAA
ncbi:epididymal secretory protein 4-like [Podarcis raffonei]|uniref:epididymal secretory protein 4-like n=1 Tax=Podarcis raffonei TaxID=65483 RepID=UPI002329132A|nr:epididymal secretory protein 4-like [Podarcis raffonei]